MKWSDRAWEAIGDIYKKTLDLPFIQELISGKLDKEKFNFYIQQDALYLADYGKVLTGIASRLFEPEHIQPFIAFAGETMIVEKELHKSFVKEINTGNEIEASPACLFYTSYLLKQLATAPVEVIVAAVLPCFWIYKEVGDYILEKQSKDNNPYQAWIDTYGGDEYAASVKTAIYICNELAEKSTPEQQEQMIEAFVICSKLEWMFWDSAYNLEQWKI